jgi:hypothetical protein
MISDLIEERRMRAMNKKIQCAYYLLPLAFYLFLFACGGSGPGNSASSSTSSGTGAVAFDLEWQHSSQASIFPDESLSAQQVTVRASSDICLDYGISTVSATIFNSSNVQIASGSWPCSAHSGTITGVPAGSNYMVRLEGTVSGGALNWRGEKGGITVNAGSTTNAGTITMIYIGNDTTLPTVSSSNPASNATDVAVTTAITAIFSEAMALSSINTTSFTLQKGATPVSGTVSYNSSIMTATFTPSSNLDYSASYTAAISTDVQDMAGNHMASAYSWSFTTASLLWTKQWGTTARDMGNAVAVDDSGNIYVTGYSTGNLDGNTNAGGADIFLTKFNSSGTKQWTRLAGTTGDDQGNAVAADSSGNIYVTGYTSGTLDGNAYAGGGDIFLIKFDRSGNKLWSLLAGTDGFDSGNGIGLDSSGNIYITGFTSGSLDQNTNAGGSDIFLIKYDSSGTKQWTRLAGTIGQDSGTGVAIDNSGNVYVTGLTQGNLDGNINAGPYDSFLMKFDSAGIKQWTRLSGTTGDDQARAVGVDNSGNVYVTGLTQGNLDGNINAGGGYTDIFLMKYDSSGTKQWTRLAGTPSWDMGYGVAVDRGGNVYVTGLTQGNLDGNINAGPYDSFLMKFDSAGIKQWTRLAGVGANGDSYGVAVDTSGSVYLTGATSQGLDGNTNAGGSDIFLMKFDSNGTKQ